MNNNITTETFGLHLEGYNNRQDNTFKIINQILVLLFCIWFTIPYFQYHTGHYAGAFIIMMWFFTTDYMWLVKKWTKDLIFIFIFIFTLIPYIITGTFQYGQLNPGSIFGAIIIFFSGFFINHYYMYYKKDYIVLGRIALITIVGYTIGAVQTYLGYIQYNITRTSITHGQSAEFYKSIGLGGYDFIHSLFFILLAYSFILSSKSSGIKKNYKFLIFLSLVIMLLTIIESSYATALMLLIIGFLSLLIKHNIITYIFLIALIIFMFTFGANFLGNLFLALADLLETNNTFYEKALDFAILFLEGHGQTMQISDRYELYKMSFLTFLNNPLFGMYGPFGKTGPVGGHAGWLDMMAFYGSFTVLPMFIAMYYNFKKHLLYYKDNAYYKYYFICGVLFFVLGFAKSNMYVYNVGLAMFLILPAVPFLSYAFKRKI